MSSANLLEKPATGRSANPKMAAVLTLGLVFLCGAAAGAVAHNLLHHSPPFDSPRGQSLYFDKLQKELDLTPAQTDEVRSILGDMWQYYRTVLSESKERVERVLNEEQRKKFERILQDQKLH